MQYKTFAISDIHGCYDELMSLYKQLPIDPEKDRMVFCGDHIDRGSQSRQVVQQLMDWKKKYPHWVVLYGNHEDLMLDALMYGGRRYNSFDLWFNQGGKQTYYSYLPKDLTRYERAISSVKDTILKEHLEFLAALPRWFEDEKYIYVHGGLKPGKAPEETDSDDIIWIRDEFIFSEYDWGKKVIFGHSVDADGEYMGKQNGGKMIPFEPIVLPNKIGIDTAICPPSKRKLTAVELPTEKFYFQKSLSKMI